MSDSLCKNGSPSTKVNQVNVESLIELLHKNKQPKTAEEIQKLISELIPVVRSSLDRISSATLQKSSSEQETVKLKDLLKTLGLKPRDIIRSKDESFAALNLKLDDDAAVLKALVKHPELLERPIVVQGSKAVVARPPEKVRELFKTER